jgi:hypothetical protein
LIALVAAIVRFSLLASAFAFSLGEDVTTFQHVSGSCPHFGSFWRFSFYLNGAMHESW